MKIGQVLHEGRVTAAIQNGAGLQAIPGVTVSDLCRLSDERSASLSEVTAVRTTVPVADEDRAIPIHPEEVWACGCTYAPSADFRDGEIGTREGMYSYVHKPENRPEIFFKGTARVCVGPDDPIGIRADSTFTAPEPEIGIVIGSSGTILALTLGNDVSAWDIERENALYLPQSKVYDRCCAIGPVLVTPDEVDDPYSLEMTCTIQRGDALTFEGSVSTSKLRRRLEELVDCLILSNAVPTPTVVLTGTGIIVEQEAALQPGDICSIHVPEIGTLSNPAVAV